MNANEIKATIFTRKQQVDSINASLRKLDNRQVADETAVSILVNARWKLCKEIQTLEDLTAREVAYRAD